MHEAEAAVRLRCRALQDPKGTSAAILHSGYGWTDRLKQVSVKIAGVAASLLKNESDWLRLERAMAAQFIATEDLQFPGASTEGVAQELRQFMESNEPWIGPVPFEIVPPALMKSKQTILIRGKAYMPQHGLRPHVASSRVPQSQPNPHRQWPADPRLAALCKLWVRLMESDVSTALPVQLHHLPPCMQNLMTTLYPEHKHRQVATNVICRLGHRVGAEKILMKRWTLLIDTKYPAAEQRQKKKTEVSNAIKSLSKTSDRASYSCSWMQTNQLCPHFQYPKNTPSDAIRRCFGCKVPARPSPVVWVIQRSST